MLNFWVLDLYVLDLCMGLCVLNLRLLFCCECVFVHCVDVDMWECVIVLYMCEVVSDIVVIVF